MANKISGVIDALNLYTLGDIAINNDKKMVNVEFFDQEKNSHKVEFREVDTYFFLDKDMGYDIAEIEGSVKCLNPNNSEVIGVKTADDGSISEKILASPNIILNTESANILLKAESVTIDGTNYRLGEMLN